MTEAELLENSLIAWSNFVTTFGVALTVVSGYLIAAYTTGASLTRSQVSIINGLYLGTILSLLGGLYGFRATAADLETIAWAMSTQRTYAPIPWIAWGALVFIFLCALSSLKFMWDIRHSKTE